LKIPFPIPSFSGLLSQFRKRGAEEPEDQDAFEETEESVDATPVANEDDGNSREEDALTPAGKPERNWGRVAALEGASPSAIGMVAGWLIVNAEHVTEARAKLRPTLTVDILAEGGHAPENSSRMAMGKTAHGDGHGNAATADKSGHGDTAANARGAEAKAPVDHLAGVINPDLVEETKRRSRIVIIVTSLDLFLRSTEAALQALPPEVTLSFSSITPDLQGSVARAWRKGHEALVDLPMEPVGFPRNDPGRNTLLTMASEVENLNRLESVMKSADGYVGLLATMGSQFAIDVGSLSPVLKLLKERSLLFVGHRATSRSIGPELASQIQLPPAFSNRKIDSIPSVRANDTRLQELEETSKVNRLRLVSLNPIQGRSIGWPHSCKC
jgi:polysaccharide deacetylase 2 family uncharacterized protein YibQ